MPETSNLMYRERTEPDYRRLPVPAVPAGLTWTAAALNAYVMRHESLTDVIVVWAEVYDHNTGDVIARYEHPRLRS
jgi:hypothetical protein